MTASRRGAGSKARRASAETLQHMFVMANAFSASADILWGESGRLFPVPSACSSFALELYLKCVIGIESKQLILHEHDLRKLFHRTSRASQTAIRSHADAVIKQDLVSSIAESLVRVGKPIPPTIDFAYVLRISAKAFESFRCVDEAGQRQPDQLISWWANPIRNAALLRVIELRPDFATEGLLPRYPDFPPACRSGLCGR
jgi:hypothetical protein